MENNQLNSDDDQQISYACLKEDGVRILLYSLCSSKTELN